LLDKDFIYFLFAFYFHFTPDVVDSLENYRVESFLICLPEWVKKMNEANKCPMQQAK